METLTAKIGLSRRFSCTIGLLIVFLDCILEASSCTNSRDIECIGNVPVCKNERLSYDVDVCPDSACRDSDDTRDSVCCFKKRYSRYVVRSGSCLCPRNSSCGRIYHRNPHTPISPGVCTPLQDAVNRLGFCKNPHDRRHHDVCPLNSCRRIESVKSCCMARDNKMNLLLCSCDRTVECYNDQETLKGRPGESSDSVSLSESGGRQEDKPSERKSEVTSRSLCKKQNRLLNGNRVKDLCEYRGIANLTAVYKKGNQTVACNAVYTVAKVRGTTKSTFLTSRTCKSLIDPVRQEKFIKIDIQIGKQKYPVQRPIFTTEDGPNGSAFIDINPRFANLFTDLGDCQREACPYNPALMKDLINTSDCKVVSWGSSDTSTLASDGLYETAVRISFSGCQDPGTSTISRLNNRWCVKTLNGKNLYCLTDTGAPTYCKVDSTNERILMGVLAFQAGCDQSPEANVIPFPL